MPRIQRDLDEFTAVLAVKDITSERMCVRASAGVVAADERTQCAAVCLNINRDLISSLPTFSPHSRLSYKNTGSYISHNPPRGLFEDNPDGITVIVSSDFTKLLQSHTGH